MDKENPRRFSPEMLVECPDCRRRFVGEELAGKSCPNCGGTLSKVAPESTEPRPDEPIVEIFRAPDMPRAEMIRQMLESEGIAIAFRTNVPWGVLTFTVDGLGEVGILALESEAERARTLLRDYLAEAGEDEPNDSEEKG